jgi:hypothetical protein
MAVWRMNRKVDLPWQSTGKRSLETVMFHNVTGLLEMAVCCAKPPYAAHSRPLNYSEADAFILEKRAFPETTIPTPDQFNKMYEEVPQAVKDDYQNKYQETIKR